MFIGTSAQLSAVVIDSVEVAVSTNIKSLGVIIDSRLSFDLRVNAIARACNYSGPCVTYVDRLITVDITKTLACSIVGARFGLLQFTT